MGVSDESSTAVLSGEFGTDVGIATREYADPDVIRVVTDIEECEHVWRRAIPARLVTDLWEVRACFHRNFRNAPYFIVSEQGGEIEGLLPLSRIKTQGRCLYFPGETWKGASWLEQNQIVCRKTDFTALADRCPWPFDIRYLLPGHGLRNVGARIDDLGYLFYPSRYQYDMENYFQEFSRKSAKRIKKEVDRISANGVRFRFDDPADFDLIMSLNIGRFGKDSYFYDPRFRESFRSLTHYLKDRGLLRMTTVLIGGVPAAVDLGCIYQGIYTVFAGGTHASYPGVAKLINLYHMEYACRQKLSEVDFLCGDFSWKTMFHLTPRTLYRTDDVRVLASRASESMAVAM